MDNNFSDSSSTQNPNPLWVQGHQQGLYDTGGTVGFYSAQRPYTYASGQAQLGLGSTSTRATPGPGLGFSNMNMTSNPGGPHGWHPNRLLPSSSARTRAHRFQPYSVTNPNSVPYSNPWASGMDDSGVHRTPYVNRPAPLDTQVPALLPNAFVVDPTNLPAWSHDFSSNDHPDFEPAASSGSTADNDESSLSDSSGDTPTNSALILPCPPNYKPCPLPIEYLEAAQTLAGPQVDIPLDLPCYESLIPTKYCPYPSACTATSAFTHDEFLEHLSAHQQKGDIYSGCLCKRKPGTTGYYRHISTRHDDAGLEHVCPFCWMTVEGDFGLKRIGKHVSRCAELKCYRLAADAAGSFEYGVWTV